jgi:hypothetical protein
VSGDISDITLRRLEVLEREVRMLRHERAQDIKRLAEVAMRCMQLNEVVTALNDSVRSAHLRIDMHVDCIRKLNGVVARQGFGRHVA